jgi:hypothetical protein
MEKTQEKMTVWLVAPGAHYEGETVAEARVFRCEVDARAYEAELMEGATLGVDYVVVQEMEVVQ